MNLSNGGSETKKAEESAQDLAPPEAASGSRAQAQVSQNQEHPQANQNLANQDLASQNLANKDLANQNLAKKDSANPNHLSDGDNDNAESRALRPNFLTATRFSDFDLPQEIMSGIDAAGFDCCTPIQAQVIPVALSGEDVAGQAQTGTGKTTAFLVPVLTRLLRRQPMAPGLPRALVITPTRELAVQIHKDAKLLAGATELTHALVVGGLEYREQAEALEAGADLIICTPGRLIDYLYKRVFVPTAIEVVVVDEADRLLDMGFIKDLKTILSQLPPYNHRQTMLFSATLDDRVLELTYQYMNPPQYITAEPDPTSKIQIDQSLYHISHREKLPLLLGLLSKEEHNRVIIFCNTKSGVEWLTKKLVYNGFQAEGITGDLPQPKRLKLMEAFKEQRLQIMVATDVASRGIHVEDVSHVYNFDLPQDAENYIHRIGRTARAGKSGKAVSFASEEHVFHLEAIENILGEKIPVVWPDDDMFAVDHGQDFKPKERERERKPYVKDRERRIPSTPSSISAPEAPRSSERRDKVRIQRPGGIFGLSPRFPVLDGVSDPRQELTWRPADVKNDPPETVRSVAQNAYDSHAQAIDREASGLTEAWPAAQGGHGSFEERATEPREGRRRKRRRGKGPKDHELPQAGQTAITIGSSDYSQDNIDLRSPEGSGQPLETNIAPQISQHQDAGLYPRSEESGVHADTLGLSSDKPKSTQSLGFQYHGETLQIKRELRPKTASPEKSADFDSISGEIKDAGEGATALSKEQDLTLAAPTSKLAGSPPEKAASPASGAFSLGAQATSLETPKADSIDSLPATVSPTATSTATISSFKRSPGAIKEDAIVQTDGSKDVSVGASHDASVVAPSAAGSQAPHKAKAPKAPSRKPKASPKVVSEEHKDLASEAPKAAPAEKPKAARKSKATEASQAKVATKASEAQASKTERPVEAPAKAKAASTTTSSTGPVKQSSSKPVPKPQEAKKATEKMPSDSAKPKAAATKSKLVSSKPTGTAGAPSSPKKQGAVKPIKPSVKAAEKPIESPKADKADKAAKAPKAIGRIKAPKVASDEAVGTKAKKTSSTKATKTTPKTTE